MASRKTTNPRSTRRGGTSAADGESCGARVHPRKQRGRSRVRECDQTDAPWRVLHGDCLELLADLSPCSVDAVVCDPPYGINFKGHQWDQKAIRDSAAATTSNRGRLSNGQAFQEWASSWAEECLRTIKPGGHLLAFGSPRTFHRLVAGLEDAGFQLRDTLIWLYGSGMPKSRRMRGGQSTTLKPAWEPILLARKPPVGTIEQNVRRHRTGALNIDACRHEGRWPTNVLLGHHERCTPNTCDRECALVLIDKADQRTSLAPGTRTPPSRMFFSSKASRSERDAGCEHIPPSELDLFQQASSRPAVVHNPHPTVKPIALMRWLVRLTCPPGGLVLDPFCGSGSTGAAAVLEDRRFLGIEREDSYVQIARARLTHYSPATNARKDKELAGGPFAPKARRRR